MKRRTDPNSKPTQARKTYRRPVFSVYGDVRRLTAGGGGTQGDGPGMMTKACWIAEALYGVHSPRVILVRNWLSRRYDRGDAWARVVVPLYRVFGRQIAAAVRRSSILAAAFRPLFDHAARRACAEYAALARQIRA